MLAVPVLQGHATTLLSGGNLSDNNFDLLDTSNTRDSYHRFIGDFIIGRSAGRYVADAPAVTDGDTIPKNENRTGLARQ